MSQQGDMAMDLDTAFWIGRAGARLEEIRMLNDTVARAHRLQAEHKDKADGLAHENALLKAEAKALEAQIEKLGSEWAAMGQKVMDLELENAELRRQVAEGAGVEPTPVAEPPRRGRRPKEKPKKAPIVRNCKTCGGEFEVSQKNRLYCENPDCPPGFSKEKRS